jgi:hypothetical protein
MAVRMVTQDFSLCGSSIFLEPAVIHVPLSRRSELNIKDGHTHSRLQLRDRS